MKTHRTKRIYRVRCKSGLMGWRTRLRNIYHDYGEFVSFSQIFGLYQRLGYISAINCWNANPVVEGSVNPSDYRKVKA